MNNAPVAKKSLFAPLQMALGFLFRPIGKLIGFILKPIGKGLAKVPMPYREYVMPAVAVFIALFGIPLLGSYWVKVFTQVAIFAVVAIGANILYGRVGLASLCQIGLMGIGTWCTLRIEYATHMPLPIVWIIGALITTVCGVIVGLPALRLSGLYLAMITLMAAGGITIVLNGLSFPNGGPGFKGLVTTVETRETMGRPVGFSGDNAWYRLCVGVVVVALLIALWHLRNRPGRAWASIRQSEAAALAAGIDVTRYKLWAFALASFLTGLAGGVYASSVGSPSTTTFQTPDNVTLFAVVIIGAVVIGGKYSLWGAIFAALLTGFLPAFFKLILGNVMEDPDQIGIILFGFGVLLNLVLATRAAKKKGLSL